MRTITLCLGKANRTYAGLNVENETMPSEKRFQTAFVCHAYDYALLGKANRTYAGMNVESETMPSEKRFQTAFVFHAYDYALF